MSDTVFPTLVSSSWKMTRTPQWETGVQISASGVSCRAKYRSKPLWKWTLKNGILQSADTIADLQAIEGLYNSLFGMYDSFLWPDPENSTIADGSVQVIVDGVSYWRVGFLKDDATFDRFAY